MKKMRWLALLGVLTAAAASPAAAQDTGIYLGGSMGYAQYKDTCKNLVVPCDDHDTAWRAFVGYQFNNWFGLELGFADLGAATGAGTSNNGVPADFSVAVEEAWDLTAVILFPIAERLSLLGRAGMYRARMVAEVREQGFPDIHEAGTNSGFSYGAGAEYRLGKLALRAEWQRYENVGVAATGEDDIDVLSVALLFRF